MNFRERMSTFSVSVYAMAVMSYDTYRLISDMDVGLFFSKVLFIKVFGDT